MVKLTKIKFIDLQYLVAALKFQTEQLEYSFEAAPSMYLEEELDKTEELFVEYFKKANKQFPPQNTSLVLRKYQARVLLRALHNWQLQLEKTSYEANKALVFKNLLVQQTGPIY